MRETIQPNSALSKSPFTAIAGAVAVVRDLAPQVPGYLKNAPAAANTNLVKTAAQMAGERWAVRSVTAQVVERVGVQVVEQTALQVAVRAGLLGLRVANAALTVVFSQSDNTEPEFEPEALPTPLVDKPPDGKTVTQWLDEIDEMTRIATLISERQNEILLYESFGQTVLAQVATQELSELLIQMQTIGYAYPMVRGGLQILNAAGDSGTVSASQSSASATSDDDELRAKVSKSGFKKDWERDVVTHGIFGELALFFWSFFEDRAKGVQQVHADLAKLVKQGRSAPVVQLFTDYFVLLPDINVVARELGPEYPKDVVPAFAAHELSVMIAFGYANGRTPSLPDAILIDVIRTHVAIMRKCLENLGKIGEEMKGRVGPLLRSAIEMGQLPIAMGDLDLRLSTLTIDGVDGMSVTHLDLWGSYEPVAHHVELSSLVPADDLFSTFVHEMVHALSGRVVLRKHYYFGTSYEWALKSGLHIGQVSRPKQFSWLDEAVTEQIAQDLLNGRKFLSGNCTEGLYLNERSLLTLLIASGIPRELFVQAYFENYGSDSSVHKTPALRELFRRFNERFGRGFLSTLDDAIQDRKIRHSQSEKDAISAIRRELEPLFARGGQISLTSDGHFVSR